jgi:hypothetical protein
MNSIAVRRFFGWCTVLNGGLLILASVVIRFAHDQVFWVHTHWVALTQADFNEAIYILLGIFKLLVIVFNLVPFFALVIMDRQSRPASGSA